jgi:hypothetical protein
MVPCFVHPLGSTSCTTSPPVGPRHYIAKRNQLARFQLYASCSPSELLRSFHHLRIDISVLSQVDNLAGRIYHISARLKSGRRKLVPQPLWQSHLNVMLIRSVWLEIWSPGIFGNAGLNVSIDFAVGIECLVAPVKFAMECNTASEWCLRNITYLNRSCVGGCIISSYSTRVTLSHMGCAKDEDTEL